MKKTLTLFAAAISCGIASAQTESAFVTADDYASSVSVAEGTEFCKSASVSMKSAFSNTYKRQALVGESDSFNALVIGDESFRLTAGVQGGTGPSGAKIEAPVISGAVWQFDVTESGVLYVCAKVNSGKNYYVWNVTDAANASLLAYSVSVFDAQGANYAYSMPSPSDPAFDNYVTSKKINAAGECYGEATGKTAWTGDAKGVIAFAVTAGSYYVYANGSKLTSDGFVFVKGATEVATVSTTTVADPEPDPDPETPSTAVKNVTISSLDANAPIYNLLGQRVQKGYKGICIQNGKKFMVK